MADVPDLVRADNETSARLERDRREDERLNGLVPDSPSSHQRQLERVQAEFDRVKRDLRRYEDAVDREFGEGSSRKLPWLWPEEGRDPYRP
jgi:hypothetical protein